MGLVHLLLVLLSLCTLCHPMMPWSLIILDVWETCDCTHSDPRALPLSISIPHLLPYLNLHHLPLLTLSSKPQSSLSLPPSLSFIPQSSQGDSYTCTYQEQGGQGSTTQVQGTVMSSTEVNGLDRIVIRCASREVSHVTVTVTEL